MSSGPRAEPGCAGAPAGGTRNERIARLLVILIGTGLLYGSTAALPFFSEDYAHLARAADYPSFWDAFDPTRVPFRPLQHLFFRALAALGSPEPWCARIPGFALHALSAWFVFDLAAWLAGSRRAAWVALVAFLAFPSVTGLVWIAAIGSPGRVACLLAGLCVYLRHLERPSWRTGVALVALQLVALGFHQSGFFLAPFCALLAYGRGVLARALRDPWWIATLVLSGAFVLAMSQLMQHGYPKSQPMAMAANLVRASLALAPEVMRTSAVEGLRGNAGSAGMIAGGALVAASLSVLALVLWRGSRLARALALVVALDLALPVLTVGFVVRYATFASAIVGCGLGLWLERATRERRATLASAAAALLCLAWAHDSVADVRDYRRAGALHRRVMREAQRVRAEVGPATPVALVDLPIGYGPELDIPLFQWGTQSALLMAGAPGKWLLWCTQRGQLSSEASFLSPQELEERQARGEHPILVYDPAREALTSGGR